MKIGGLTGVKKFWIITGWVVSIAALIVLAYLWLTDFYPWKRDLQSKPGSFGVTFSTEFCGELGLDWKETYKAILDELKVKYIRIPVYWDEIEESEGKFDFADYDYLIAEGEKRGAKFVINPGRRVPRWPECHGPAWLDSKTEADTQKVALDMIRAVVERYKDRDSVEYWQIENEPFLDSFGVCPALNEAFLKEEFSLVRSLDNRKIIITGSGELSSWRREGKIGDIFGSTLYRTVYNSWMGYVKYPFPVSYYRLKARLAGIPLDRMMVMELQAEPWVPKGSMADLTAEQVDKTMSIEQFRSNLQYAINLDFNRNYAWGVEWWYFQKKYGNPEYWWLAAVLFE